MKWLGRDVGRQKSLNVFKQETFATERIKDNRGNLYSVISWAGWYVRPQWVSGMNSLTRSSCSVTKTCFNCESKCFWYEMYWAGKGKEEQSQHSMPSFDKRMWRYQRSAYLKKKCMIIFYSTPAVTLLSMHPAVVGFSYHQVAWPSLYIIKKPNNKVKIHSAWVWQKLTHNK